MSATALHHCAPKWWCNKKADLLFYLLMSRSCITFRPCVLVIFPPTLRLLRLATEPYKGSVIKGRKCPDSCLRFHSTDFIVIDSELPAASPQWFRIPDGGSFWFARLQGSRWKFHEIKERCLTWLIIQSHGFLSRLRICALSAVRLFIVQ